MPVVPVGPDDASAEGDDSGQVNHSNGDRLGP